MVSRLEKSARYAYELGPQCQRGDNVSMDRRIHPSAGDKFGAWPIGSEKSARYAYELESPSVKEAATIVWTDNSFMPPTRCQAWSWGQGQPTLMNGNQRAATLNLP